MGKPRIMLRMLVNLPAVVVSAVAVEIAPADPHRRRIFIVQSSANPVRIGAAGVTAATGYRLGQNERMQLEGPECPTDAIYAIREGGADGNVSCLVDRRRT